MNRRAMIAATVPALLAGTTFAAHAQDATPAACGDAIGRFVPNGAELHGTGSVVSQPIPFTKGLVIAEVTMGAAGSVLLKNAAGDQIGLSISTDPVTKKQSTETVYTAGKYYVVVDFYSDEGE